MIVLITGGRNFDDGCLVAEVLELLHEREPITLLIEGGARGADAMAGAWADAMGVPCDCEPANWARYQNHAGRVRNCKMLRDHKHHLDVVVAFAGGSGTRHMVSIATEAGVPVIKTWEAQALSQFFESYKGKT